MSCGRTQVITRPTKGYEYIVINYVKGRHTKSHLLVYFSTCFSLSNRITYNNSVGDSDGEHELMTEWMEATLNEEGQDSGPGKKIINLYSICGQKRDKKITLINCLSTYVRNKKGSMKEMREREEQEATTVDN